MYGELNFINHYNTHLLAPFYSFVTSYGLLVCIQDRWLIRLKPEYCSLCHFERQGVFFPGWDSPSQGVAPSIEFRTSLWVRTNVDFVALFHLKIVDFSTKIVAFKGRSQGRVPEVPREPPSPTFKASGLAK